MRYKPGDTFYSLVLTGSPAPVDADALPLATVYRNGALDTGMSLSATHASTGRYFLNGTVPPGWSAGDVVQVVASASVNGAGSEVIAQEFQVEGAIPPAVEYVRVQPGLPLNMTQGDTLPGFETLPVDTSGAVIDITGAALSFRLTSAADGSTPPLISAPAYTATAHDGKSVTRYAFTASDAALLSPATYYGQFIASWGSQSIAFPTQGYILVVVQARV